jgi:hypothetical protein
LDERKDAYALFTAYLTAGAPALHLYAPTYLYARSERVRGYDDPLLYSPASRFHAVQSWYVNTRVR